jgi:hypothetical protein
MGGFGSTVSYLDILGDMVVFEMPGNLFALAWPSIQAKQFAAIRKANVIDDDVCNHLGLASGKKRLAPVAGGQLLDVVGA